MKRFIDRHILIATLFIPLFAAGTTLLLSKIPFLDPITDSVVDFDFTDFAYSDIEEREFEIDTNLVIVNISTLGRGDLARLIDSVNYHEPATVGIDVFFPVPKVPETDSVLIQALNRSPNRVMVAGIDNMDGLISSDSMFLHGGHIGVSSFRFEVDNHIRRFKSRFALNPTDTLLGFDIQLVNNYSPEKASEFLERNREFEIINYAGNFQRFLVLEHHQFDNMDLVRGKIVLLGFLGDEFGDRSSLDDRHYTPLKDPDSQLNVPDMFGVVIHANIISMILNGNYIRDMETLSTFFAYLLLATALVFFSFVYRRVNHRYSLISRSVSLAVIFLIVYSSVLLYRFHDLNFDVRLAVLFLLFAPDTYELYIDFFQPLFNRISRMLRNILTIIPAIILLSGIFVESVKKSGILNPDLHYNIRSALITALVAYFVIIFILGRIRQGGVQ